MYSRISPKSAILVVLAASFLLAGTNVQASQQEQTVEVLVQFSDDRSVEDQVRSLRNKLDLSSNRNFVLHQYTNVMNGALLRLPSGKMGVLLNQERQIQLIESEKTVQYIPETKPKSIEPHRTHKSSQQANTQSEDRNDQKYSSKQHPSPHFPFKGKYAGNHPTIGINIALIDSGIDHDHPDLEDNVKGGVSVQKETGKNQELTLDTSPDRWMDEMGHGTHVAGIIAAENNDRGVVGIAPHANLFGVKLNHVRKAHLFLSEVIAGIDWLADDQASPDMDVVNMSIGLQLPMNMQRKKNKLNKTKQNKIQKKNRIQEKQKHLRNKRDDVSQKISKLKQKLTESENKTASNSKQKERLKSLQDRRKQLTSRIEDLDDKIEHLEKYVISGIREEIQVNQRNTRKGNVLKNVIREGRKQGMTFVVAAGNHSKSVANKKKNNQIIPAAFSEVITVSALTKETQFASYSNFGNRIDLTAPGSDILSTVPVKQQSANQNNQKSEVKRYARKSGTSMSAPYVAGTVAQLLSARRHNENPLSPKQVERALNNIGEQPKEGWPNDPDNHTEPFVKPLMAGQGLPNEELEKIQK